MDHRSTGRLFCSQIFKNTHQEEPHHEKEHHTAADDRPAGRRHVREHGRLRQQDPTTRKTDGTGDADGAKKYTIGVCQLVTHDALDAATQGFIDAVKDKLGEENVTIDVQNAANDQNVCTTIVNTFVSKKVDLIMANATPALQAAYNATAEIPILGTSVTEYGVALGIDNFSGTVGGNVSGTSDLAPLTEQADMILELLPETKTVGLLYCSAEPNSEYQVQVVEEYLTGKGITCTRYSFSDSNDVAAVTTKAAADSDVHLHSHRQHRRFLHRDHRQHRPERQDPGGSRRDRASAPAAAWPRCPSATMTWATRPARWPPRSSPARRTSPRCPSSTRPLPRCTTPPCARPWASLPRRATRPWNKIQTGRSGVAT